MDDFHLAQVENSQKSRLKPNGHKGVCLLNFRPFFKSDWALILSDNLDREVIFADELVNLLHCLRVPDLDSVVVANGDELGRHLVVGDVSDVVHVRAQYHVVARAFEIEDGNGSVLRGEHADLVGVDVHITVGYGGSRVDLGFKSFEIVRPESHHAFFRRGEDELFVGGSDKGGNASLVNLDYFVNLPRKVVYEVQQAVRRSHVHKAWLLGLTRRLLGACLD